MSNKGGMVGTATEITNPLGHGSLDVAATTHKSFDGSVDP